jgi:hypothetical protein
VVDVSAHDVGMRATAYLTLMSADRPMEVDSWDDLGETDLWYVRISSAGGELVIRADDPELIEAELYRWSIIAHEHRKAWEARNRADTWKIRNGGWESARRQAAAMVAATPAAKDGPYWTSRAAALLAVLLYVASFDYETAEERRRAVVRQVLQHDTDTALEILDDQAISNAEAAHAREVLASVMRAGSEERQSIWSTVADAVDAYGFDQAVAS